MSKFNDRKSSAERGYGYKWQKARFDFLKKNPLCADHQSMGRVVSATVVDHIVPHKGDLKLFWDRKNWQPLCKQCHDIHKQRQESGSIASGCDVNGVPLSSDHHWAGGG